MLRNVKDLRSYAIHATDGLIGEVADLYFDDEGWTIRYLVVETGDWLSERKVLISPLAIGRLDWMTQQISVSLTKAEVESSPDIDTRKPVSRQHEAAYLEHYGYPNYWEGAGLWGMGAYPGDLTTEGRFEEELRTRRKSPKQPSEDYHLQSCKGVTGYHIHAKDGDIGHLEDLLVDDHGWALRYLIVNTSNWWVGHQVLIAPKWIEDVSWGDAKLSVGMTRHAVTKAPPYDSAAQLDRQQEEAIYEHYGHPGYWTSQAIRDAEAPSANR